jgi:hypothetical protein
MNESVMAIYGITRLLKSRDLGPAQLVPAIESFREEATRNSLSVVPMFAGLRAAAIEAGALLDAVEALEPAAHQVADSIVQVFGGPLKLGARQRLSMERAAVRLGTDLEAVRNLADVLHAALGARPVYVTPADLLHGRWYSSPNFVARKIRVSLGQCASEGFMAEPRVVRALLDHLFRSYAGEGHVHVEVRGREQDGRTELAVGPSDARPGAVELGLGGSLGVELEVLTSAASLLGMALEERDHERVLIITTD